MQLIIYHAICVTDDGVVEAMLVCLPSNGWPLPCVSKMRWKVLHDGNSVIKVCTCLYCTSILQLKYNCWILLQIKRTLFYDEKTDVKAEFTANITPVFSVTWSFRNHFNMLIWCFIFLWKQWHFFQDSLEQKILKNSIYLKSFASM